MKPRLLLLAFVAGLLQTPGVTAAPVPSDTKNVSGPVLTLQVKSIDELLETVRATGKNFISDVMFKEFEKEFLSKLDLNQIKGIDTKRSSALYATVGEG